MFKKKMFKKKMFKKKKYKKKKYKKERNARREKLTVNKKFLFSFLVSKLLKI